MKLCSKYLGMLGMLSVLIWGCEKTAQQRAAELEKQTSQEIADVQRNAAEDARAVRTDANEDLEEINADANAEIAKIRQDAMEERRDVFNDAFKARRKVIEERVDRFENSFEDKKVVSAEAAEWVAKVDGAESRMEKAEELLNETTEENWKNLRPVVTEAYVNLYTTLSSAERSLSSAKM